ncbi:MAG: hypothetical protein ACI389_02375 [Methanobrevibacter sp.]|uniref:hypothetical protein n=1 Tax=Methanobrevibacter sp. TaxID=66852 RepID=UPI003F02F4EA
MTENKRFERIYADVDVFCRDHNAKGVSQLIEREDYDRIVDLLNELSDENKHYKSIFFELVETALTDKSCRELYCKGILDIFNKANSLNQAREMIKEHLE